MLMTLEDWDKVAEEIAWYECWMTAQEYQIFQREYDNFLGKVFG